MRRRRALLATGVVALCAMTAPLTLGAAATPQVRQAGFCLPLIWCPDPPTPTPTGQPAPTPTTKAPVPSPEPGKTAPADDGTLAPTPAPTEPAPVERDGSAPVFTGTPAQMAAGGLSFTGLKSIAFVTVRTIDGGSVRVLKISADSITITGFALSVRPEGGSGLVTDADTMSLRGHVTVYLGSLTATTENGRSLTIGTPTPPSLDDVAPGLLHVTMGLVGTVADSIAYTNTDQRIVEVD